MISGNGRNSNVKFTTSLLRARCDRFRRGIADHRGPAPQHDNLLIYVIAHAGRDATKKNWTEFSADPEWQAVSKASEVDGKIVEKVDSTYMDPAGLLAD
jgi:hypothetical protein